IERLALPDRRAFGEVALQQNAGDARTHLDFARARGLADVFERRRQRLRRDRDHRDFRRRHACARAALVAAFVGCAVRRAACRKRERKASKETGAQNEIGHRKRRIIAAQKETRFYSRWEEGCISAVPSPMRRLKRSFKSSPTPA